MTIPEAIEILEDKYLTLSMCLTRKECIDNNTAIKMAIEALQEKQNSEDDCK